MKVDILNEIIELRERQKRLEDELNQLKAKLREEEHLYQRIRQEELASRIAESWNRELEGTIHNEDEKKTLYEREKIYN